MAHTKVLYIAPNPLDAKERHICLLPADLVNRVPIADLDQETLLRLEYGNLVSTDNNSTKLFGIISLDIAFDNIRQEIKNSKLGDTLPIAEDINGFYYIADDVVPLFDSWKNLPDHTKFDIAKRLETQMDPFREALLQTLMSLPDEQILAVFDYGFSQYNPRLMAIAVQALPESILANKDLSSQMGAEMKEVFDQYQKDREPSNIVTAVNDYPMFYAMEKLRSGVHDCHQQAWRWASVAYMANRDHDLIRDGVCPHHNYTHEGVPAFVIADAQHLIDRNRHTGHYKAVKMILDAASTSLSGHFSNKPFLSTEAYSVDSLTQGYATAKQCAGMNLVQIANMLGGKNILVKGLVDHLVNEDNVNLYDKEVIASAITCIGISKTIHEINIMLDALGSNTASNNIRELIMLATMQHLPSLDMCTALCDLHIDRHNQIGLGLEAENIPHIMHDESILARYTTRPTIDKLINLAYDKVVKVDKTLAQYADTKSNAIFIYLETMNVWNKFDPTARHCRFAAVSLTMSGTQHADLLAQLNQEAMDSFVKVAQDNGIPINSRAMLKINPLSKAKMLEIDLGL